MLSLTSMRRLPNIILLILLTSLIMPNKQQNAMMNSRREERRREMHEYRIVAAKMTNFAQNAHRPAIWPVFTNGQHHRPLESKC